MPEPKPHEVLKEKALEIILNFKPDEKFDKQAISEILKLKGQLKKAISFLSKEQQQIFELRYFDNLNTDKIAQSTGLPKEKVSKLLVDGIEDLKGLIRNGFPETNSIPDFSKIKKTQSQEKPSTIKQSQVTQRNESPSLIGNLIGLIIFLSIFIGIYFLMQKYVFNQAPTIHQVIESTSNFTKEKILHQQAQETKESIDKINLHKKRKELLAKSNNIKIAGSTSLVLLSKRWENAFNVEHSKYMLSLVSSDSNKGVNDLIEGKVNIANSSRPVTYFDTKKAGKYGVELVEHRVALDALIVIANKKNPVNEISLDNLEKIFIDEIKNWEEINNETFSKSIFPIVREKGSGTNDFAISRILEGSDFPESITRKNSNAEIIKTVSESDGAISFINSTNYPWNNPNIKHLKIKTYDNSQSISPFTSQKLNEQVIRYGDYPLAHYLYLITLSDSPLQVNEFIEWILSPKAQNIVRYSGLIPVIEEEE